MTKFLNFFSKIKKRISDSTDKQKEVAFQPTHHNSENQNECESKWDCIKLGLEKGFSNQKAIAALKKFINEMTQKCLDEGISSIAPKRGGTAGSFGSGDCWLEIGYQFRPSINSLDKLQLSCLILREANGMCMEQKLIEDSTPEEIQELFIEDDIIEKSKELWLDMAKTMWEKYV